MTLPTRGPAARRPRRDVARASAGISLQRVVAAAVLFVCAGGLFAATNAPQFGVRRAAVTIAGAHYTSADAVLAAVGIPRDAEVNAFRIRTDEIAAAVAALPPVLHADVAVNLPDRVVVRVTERTPIVVWQTPRSRFLVDVQGLLFAAAPPGDVRAPGAARASPTARPSGPTTSPGSSAPVAPSSPGVTIAASGRPTPSAPSASSAAPARTAAPSSPGPTAATAPAEAEPLPVIRDNRASGARLAVGSRLDSVDLAVVRQLGAITPAMLGSAASSDSVTVDDTRGYVLEAAPPSWVAVFGIYTPTLRGPDEIPVQVQCLRALIADREADLRTVFLFPAERRCGTFAARATPTPAASGSPSPTPRPTRRP